MKSRFMRIIHWCGVVSIRNLFINQPELRYDNKSKNQSCWDCLNRTDFVSLTIIFTQGISSSLSLQSKAIRATLCPSTWTLCSVHWVSFLVLWFSFFILTCTVFPVRPSLAWVWYSHISSVSWECRWSGRSVFCSLYRGTEHHAQGIFSPIELAIHRETVGDKHIIRRSHEVIIQVDICIGV